MLYYFKITFIPIAMISLVGFVLFKGLQLQPGRLPSTKINKPFPYFSLASLYSGEILDNSIMQNKPHIVNIWASWCEACRREHKTMLEIAKKYNISIIGIDYKDSDDTAKKYLSNYGNPYRVNLKDPRGRVGMELGVYGTPETYFVDKNGIIRYRYVGIISMNKFVQKVLPIYNKYK